MPHLILKMVSGRTETQKRTVAERPTRVVVSAFGVDEDSVSVAIEDVAMADWTKSVYVPDIQAKPDTIYKKPGYDPFP
ncbi:4-oxalocrotonate tautomerase [Rhizobium sp. P40RR-XXII]|uniref:tautomerase family protein n=1 Tax=Rhizobium sp. P40RR-XXII TaxID=2726739 RepID=UPI00145766D3|nr:tautomerase family protein [Rhizobium sp. P40RR-XXII]NLS17166.1 4-oxalocrotonate tautomerase [Rhizobium sp. P40RR-XXII]